MLKYCTFLVILSTMVNNGDTSNSIIGGQNQELLLESGFIEALTDSNLS